MNKYNYWLGTLPGIGDATIYRLLSVYGAPEMIYQACVTEKKTFIELIGNKVTGVIERTKNADLEREMSEYEKKGIKAVSISDAGYPLRLKKLNNAPYIIYYKGELPSDNIPSVAIIGARNCSEYGTYVADAFGTALAGEGVNIISGMARGIDGISQRGALKSGGRTYAVLGSGVDVCYPQGNYKLYSEIQKDGGILSSFPPGSAPAKQNFPQRNRIVAGLSDIVLVIEARQKSGTSITIDLALKMGKDVYAVPGRLTDRLSDGCNMLIKEGAGVALSPEDIIRELSIIWGRQKPDNSAFSYSSIHKIPTGQPKKDEGILKYVDVMPRTVNDIHKQRLKDEPNASINDTMSQLVLRCLTGEVTQVGSGYFSAKIG